CTARQLPRSRTTPIRTIGCRALLLRDDDAAHELVPRAADARALERVAAGLWLEVHRRHTASALRQFDIDVCADDMKSVCGVVALQPNLERRASFDADLRGRESESLSRDLDHARILRESRSFSHDNTNYDRERQQPD